jgi:tetratricopeptide (TPR) repeat protein
MEKAWPTVTKLPSTGKHGAFFQEMIRSCSSTPTAVDINECIEVGNTFFKDAVDEEKCKLSSRASITLTIICIDHWYYILAFFNYRRNNIRQGLHWCEFALSQKQDNTSPVYCSLLELTSVLLTMSGKASGAINLARKASQISEFVGDTWGQSRAMKVECTSQFALGNLRCAGALAKAAHRLGPPEMKEACKEHLACVHLAKTEYQEAQDLLLQNMAYWTSLKTPVTDTVLRQLMLAEIAIETGGELEDISRHIEVARIQCNTFVVWPVGLIHCDRLTADLHLLQGKFSVAREFETCLLSYQQSQDAEGIELVLKRLADIQYGIHSHRTTWKWTIILLAHALATKSRGAIAKALRCIGDLLVEDDENTSLSLFSAALDAFTFMDVHRDRADCMVRIAAIFEHRGEIENAVDLLQKARPLYARSSQTQEIFKIDAKLQSVTPIVENHETRRQRLAELNVPVGDWGEARLEELEGQ